MAVQKASVRVAVSGLLNGTPGGGFAMSGDEFVHRYDIPPSGKLRISGLVPGPYAVTYTPPPGYVVVSFRAGVEPVGGVRPWYRRVWEWMKGLFA